jgi:hypothetical protein
MNKRSWFFPILMLLLNALIIIVRWRSLMEIIPAHFDLQGNAGGTMPRSVLLLYPLIGAVICMIAYIIARIKQKFQSALIILTTGISLVLLLSTLVTLTSGTMPIFMLAEPVVLLVAVIGSVVCVVKSRKKKD